MRTVNKPSEQELKDFVERYSWRKQMDRSKGLDGWANYGGPDLGDWVVVVGRSRDSEVLDESNFECALDQLGGESKHVQVNRFGHWGCGWFELILVNPKSKRALIKAFEIKAALENYPVLDDSDYSDRESEKYSEYAESAQEELAEALSKHFGVKNTKALKTLAYRLNMECQYYYGGDSCVNVYLNRTPEGRDLEQLKTCLEQMHYGDEAKSKAYRDLCKALGMEMEVAS